ncbi:hypothetical protein ACQXW1_17735, partial [Lactiplantibacillus pentosus]
MASDSRSSAGSGSTAVLSPNGIRVFLFLKALQRRVGFRGLGFRFHTPAIMNNLGVLLVLLLLVPWLCQFAITSR